MREGPNGHELMKNSEGASSLDPPDLGDVARGLGADLQQGEHPSSAHPRLLHPVAEADTDRGPLGKRGEGGVPRES